MTEAEIQAAAARLANCLEDKIFKFWRTPNGGAGLLNSHLQKFVFSPAELQAEHDRYQSFWAKQAELEAAAAAAEPPGEAEIRAFTGQEPLPPVTPEAEPRRPKGRGRRS